MGKGVREHVAGMVFRTEADELVFASGFEYAVGTSNEGRTVRKVFRVAGEEGFEPSLTDSESAVLPLDDSPAQVNYSIGLDSGQ